MIKGALEKLDLPDFPHKESLEDARREMLRILLENEYGVMPERELSVSFKETERDKKFCAGKADLSVINITAKFKNGEFTFPARVVIPKGKEKIPGSGFMNALSRKKFPTDRGMRHISRQRK